VLTRDRIEELFPNGAGQVEDASDPDDTYNCIAWSVNDKARWWWPFDVASPYIYWPADVPREETVEAFVKLYEWPLFTKCDRADREEGYDKDCALGGLRCADARCRWWQEDRGWTSKLGEEQDVVHHSLALLEGGVYGTVAHIMRRKRGRT
jgi:hypothetical protein